MKSADQIITEGHINSVQITATTLLKMIKQSHKHLDEYHLCLDYRYEDYVRW